MRREKSASGKGIAESRFLDSRDGLKEEKGFEIFAVPWVERPLLEKYIALDFWLTFLLYFFGSSSSRFFRWCARFFSLDRHLSGSERLRPELGRPQKFGLFFLPKEEFTFNPPMDRTMATLKTVQSDQEKKKMYEI